MRSVLIAALWAVKQTRHDWRVVLCFVVALAAVLAPLLVLFGLKFGVVNSLTNQLIEDPRNREIIPLASGRFDPAWFATLAQRGDVGFLVPRTRQIAASIELRRPGTLDAVMAEMVPTAAGDPLLPKGAPQTIAASTIWISAAVASRLQVRAGDEVEATVTRTVGGNRERASTRLGVAGVLSDNVAREVALIPLPVLTAAEDYRDGRAVPELGWPGEAGSGQARVYSGFRLYARSIFDVAALESVLARQKIEVRTRSEDIARVVTLDRNLSLIFRVVAAIGGIGFLVSIGANLWTSVEANRRELSVLRLVGMPTAGLVLFPMITGLLVALAGVVLSVVAYFLSEVALNRLFADALPQGAAICKLTGTHLATAALLTVATATAVAALGGWRAAQIEPSEGIRDV